MKHCVLSMKNKTSLMEKFEKAGKQTFSKDFRHMSLFDSPGNCIICSFNNNSQLSANP